ncbi:hypothetical protein NM09_20265 [Vibrio caribbeanicus]|uniref:Uncharacterized protein n=1 Tax=Vibrio caribbeanicus TaxID=701175 RepID=A0ACC4NRE8_9VIBR|nr:DUF2971 domain-containing protein [Vibrio caribbeanicus]KHD23099.1 hypothetical protein NM09_20265 [Vibrio caribbeanicus]
MSFYKYTTIDTAKIVLENETLRWSSPLLFNDIEECQFTPFTEEQHKKAQRYYHEMLIDCAKGRLIYNYHHFSEVTRMLIDTLRFMHNQGSLDNLDYKELLQITDNPQEGYREYVNKGLVNIFRIICVTTEYNNNLMWAHYGDQHYGCALEFSDVYKDKPRNLEEGFVRYHENLSPRSNPIDMMLFGETKEVRSRMIEDIIFSKRTSWAYEKEYRFMFAESFGQITTTLDLRTNERRMDVSHQTDTKYTDVPFRKESLKSITFGVRATKESIENLVVSLSSKNYDVELFQLKLVNGELLRERMSPIQAQL